MDPNITLSVYDFGLRFIEGLVNLVLLICPALANSAEPDQLASEEANWSWSALFAIK